MTNVIKKLSALLLALALAVTMMPLLAIEANAADDKAFDYSVNGYVLGSVDMKWMEENTGNPQIFPWLASQGKTVGYYVVAGASYEKILSEFYGIDSYSDVPADSSIELLTPPKNGSQDTLEVYAQGTVTFDFLSKSTDLFRVAKANGEDYFTQPINKANERLIAKKEGTVQPVIAVYRELFKEADDAVADISESAFPRAQKSDAFDPAKLDAWKSSHKVSDEADLGVPVINHLAANLTDVKDDLTKEVNGAWSANSDSILYVGKLSAKGLKQIDVKVALKAAEKNITFTSKDAQTADADLGVGAGMSKVLLSKAAWTTDNDKVATVAAGVITPTGEGTCKITAKLGDEQLAVFNVTVDKKAFEEPVKESVKESVKAPAAPKSFKAKNVKNKSVKLTWKKVSGAAGYEVFRSSKKNKGFKKIKTIKKTKTVKFTNKKLKKGKTYYFKIRAYKTVDGKKIYSKYTAVKKVKIKK